MIYAYGLITNHVHLVIAPGEDPDNRQQGGSTFPLLDGRKAHAVNSGTPVRQSGARAIPRTGL